MTTLEHPGNRPREMRAAVRHAVSLPLRLSAEGPDGGYAGIAGTTEDLSVAGVRLRSCSPLPDNRALVTLTLPSGQEVVSWADVVACEARDDGSWESRLAFDNPTVPFRATVADALD